MMQNDVTGELGGLRKASQGQLDLMNNRLTWQLHLKNEKGTLI